MHSVWMDLFLLLSVVLAAMASPGPDMILIAACAVRGGARAALACIAGIVLGIATHLAFALTGLAALARLQPALLDGARWAGAAWLLWLGIGALRAQGHFSFAGATTKTAPYGPFLAGLVSNLLNVKVLLMMLALFTQLLSPEAPLPVRLGGAMLVLVEVTLVWSAFAWLIRRPAVAAWLEARALWLDRIFGALLVLIAVAIAWPG